MTYTAISSTSAISSSQDSQHQFQQPSWTFNYEENRTAMSLPVLVSGVTDVEIIHLISGIDMHKVYWELLSEALRVTPKAIGNWSILKNREVLPSSSEAFQDLIKTALIWREKSTSASLLAEAQLQQAERLYAFRDEAEVKSTLREYPFLIQLLLDTYSQIEEHFPDSQVFLEVVMDYEDMDYDGALMNNNKELTASISTTLSPEKAIDALTSFYNDWWLKASSEAKGKISIGLEFL